MTTAIISIETVLLVILLVLVAGLLRSHAEILRRLADPNGPATDPRIAPAAARERPAALRELAPDGIPVIMSSAAWRDYEVPGAPYFVLVDETIRGEGAATSWTALSSLVSDAIADARDAERATAGSGADGSTSATSQTGRALSVDRTLAAAGIGPDHPSLYPATPADPS